MKEYHKIQTVFKRDPATKLKTLLESDYSLPEFEYLASNQWVFTEKVDGTNIRVMFDGERITFAGKNIDSQIPGFLAARLNDTFFPQFDKFKELFPHGICLYGEGYGAKIQKSGVNYRPDQNFVLFDINIDGWWLQRKDIEQISKFLSLDVVPIIGHGTLADMVEKTRAGFKSAWGDFMAEGIVARPMAELNTRKGERIITKVKYKDFRRELRFGDTKQGKKRS